MGIRFSYTGLSILLGVIGGYLAVYLGIGSSVWLSSPNANYGLQKGLISGIILAAILQFIPFNQSWRRNRIHHWLMAIWMILFTLSLTLYTAMLAAV